MSEREPLEPERIAAAIAPVIDRLRLAVVMAIRPTQAVIAERLGVPNPVLGPLGMLRNTMPDRAFATGDVLELFPYQPAEQVRAGIEGLLEAELLEATGSDQIRLAETGRAVILELFEHIQRFVDERWADRADLVGELLPLATRACAAVTETGAGAVRLVAPPYHPPNASPSLLLVETLSPLRFHRSDAHVAAWRAAGLTAEQMQQLETGPLRQQIEAETNRRAAPPYAVLTADERLTLLSGLGALPN